MENNNKNGNMQLLIHKDKFYLKTGRPITLSISLKLFMKECVRPR